MKGEWTRTTLGSVTEWKSGGTPSKRNDSYWNGSIPWISASSMKSTFLYDSDQRITEEGLANGSRLTPTDSILLLVRGSELHKRVPIGITTRSVAFNQDVKALRPNPSVLPRFLYYWLLSNETLLLGKVEHTGIGAGKLDTSVLQGMALDLPPLPTQRRIAHILGTLDDKIELNRRMNRTLEKMAAAIFKSWFIDFAPVHAKADGRDPGLPADIADLFPDTFEDSVLGQIPKGWKVGRLDDLLVLQRGFDLPVGQRKPGSVPVVMASGIGDYHNEYKVSGPGVVTGRSGKLGDVFLIPSNFWPLNTTLWVKEYRETRPCHAYLLLKELALSSYNAGSAVPTLNRNHIHNVRVVLPPHDIVDAYEHIAMSFYRKCWGSEEQNCRLSGLRDTLLPKLMSGEIDLTDLLRSEELTS